MQEYAIFGERTKEVFPGCPEVRDGHMWSNGKPGLGIDIDEELAAKFPPWRMGVRGSVERGSGAPMAAL